MVFADSKTGRVQTILILFAVVLLPHVCHNILMFIHFFDLAWSRTCSAMASGKFQEPCRGTKRSRPRPYCECSASFVGVHIGIISRHSTLPVH